MKGKRLENSIIKEVKTIDIDKAEEFPVKKENKKKFMTLFLLFFPTILIMALGAVMKNQIIFLSIACLLAFYQFVVIKNFIDTYYD